MKCFVWGLLITLSAGPLLPSLSRAADPEFVGVMALVVEQDVAKQLGLSQVEHEKLFNWVDDRELAATDLVLSLRDKPDEQRAKLKEFAAESERLGLEMLNDEQRKRLQQLFIKKQGLGSLGRTEIQAKLNLDDDQRETVAKLLADREEAFGKAAASQMASTRAFFERKLAAVLSDEQRLAWEKLAGRAAADAVVADADGGAADEISDADINDAGDGDVAAQLKDSDDNRTNEPRPPVVPDETDVAVAPAEIDKPRRPDGEIKLRFNFRYAPWDMVLEWFADQADLSLELANTPEGTFNYTDRREYTPAEAIDLLNSVLLTKGYTLVRHRRLLMVLNLEDGIPPNLIETVPVDELDDRGRFELISALFKLDEITAEDAENEVRKLLGPQGSIVVLPKTKALLITETGGRLRVIRDLLKAAEKPEEVIDDELNEIPLEYALAEEVLGVIRQLMGLPEDRNAAADGSLRIATDTLGTRLFVTGSEENVQKVKDILKLVDVPNGLDGTPGVIETPQLEVYSITSADPESVLKVMQTLMAGESGVRLDIDPKTGAMVALARPSQHATIKATIDQMQRDGRMIEVIQLRVVDPQLAVLSINKLFGAGEEGGNNRAPLVDADPIAAQLLIRGTESQIEQIRSLMEKMGESGFDDDPALAQAERGNVRMIPLTGGSARSALEQLETIWPSMRSNRIRVVSPSAAVREMRNGSRREDISPSRGLPLGLPADLNQLNDLFQRFEIKPRQPAEGTDQPKGDAPKSNGSDDPQASETLPSSPFRFAAARKLLAQADESDDVTGGGDAAAPPKDLTIGAEPPTNEETPNRPGADIIVAPGPGGILIASEDLDALDEFEEMLQMLASRGSTGREYTVFYLKYARADVAAELLTEILGGGGGAADAGGGGGLFGDLASAALGNAGGGLVGSLLGLGGGGGAISTSGAVTMVSDRRLNALVVEANNEDLDLVEQLLEVIDQEASPEDVQTFARPRLIPVFYTSAEEIAGVVKQVYSERLSGAGGGSRNNQPSPEEFIRALRGGRGGRGGGGSAQDEEQKMTIGVDARSNSLVVSAPEPMFQEIKALVEQLDKAGAEETETVRVITLENASPDLVRKAIVSITGGNVTTSTSSTGQGTSGQPANTGQPAGQQDGPAQTPEQMRDQVRQRIELFNALQRQGQGQGQQDGRDGGGRSGGGNPRGGGDGGPRGFGAGQPGGGFRAGGGQRGGR